MTKAARWLGAAAALAVVAAVALLPPSAADDGTAPAAPRTPPTQAERSATAGAAPADAEREVQESSADEDGADHRGLRGRFVERGTGRGIAGAEVSRDGERIAVTDGAGVFAVEIGRGPVTLLAAAPGAIGWATVPGAAEDLDAELTIESQPTAALALTVLLPPALADHESVVAALPEFGPARLWPEIVGDALYDRQLAPVLVRTLDDSALLTFDALPVLGGGGTCQYGLVAAGVDCGSVMLMAGAEVARTLDLGALAPEHFAVRLADEAGEPAAGALVRQSGVRSAPLQADLAGRFELARAPQPGQVVELAIECAGFAPARAVLAGEWPSAAAAGAAAGEPVLVLPRAAAIRGTVVDAAGQPCAGVPLQLEPGAPGPWTRELRWWRSNAGDGPAQRVRGWTEATVARAQGWCSTDGAGRFEVACAAGAAYTIAFASGREQEVLAGAADVRLMLPVGRGSQHAGAMERVPVELELDPRDARLTPWVVAIGRGENRGLLRHAAARESDPILRLAVEPGEWQLEISLDDAVVSEEPLAVRPDATPLRRRLRLPDWGVVRVAPELPAQYTLRAGAAGESHLLCERIGDPLREMQADAGGVEETMASVVRAGTMEIAVVGGGQAARAHAVVLPRTATEVRLEFTRCGWLRSTRPPEFFGAGTAFEVRDGEQAWRAVGSGSCAVLPGRVEWRVRSGQEVVAAGALDVPPGEQRVVRP